ncbi:AAA family ATPase [Veillonella sp.]|uniref:AAA family ATPase n=1 Tax=Veillonella sp. TaxID=1926307 RepID=UPI0025D3D711|nr:AAA family ATPase [Veillonella sp.]
MKFNLLDPLSYINPQQCSYEEWVQVGMALHHEGYLLETWDEWSRKDSARYHEGETAAKWKSFGNDKATIVTGATITQLAKMYGWSSKKQVDEELDWNAEIFADDVVVVQQEWLEGTEIPAPGDDYNPVNDIITYLQTLFDSTENVGYVTKTWETDEGKFAPTKGNYDRTAGELIEALRKCKGDIGGVLGDINPEVGAWIRFNPVDGKGIKNENVTDYKYTLVECDSGDLEKQYESILQLELPVACLVHSGGKSIHAIVKVDAGDIDEYRKRVEYVYKVCKKNGINVDIQNKNPSRLSRLPGVQRNGKWQYLIATNIGQEDFTTWKEWIEAVNDDLPEPEGLASVWDNLPDLAPPLIDGVLRQGHKMLVAGPSKAGKSYALIELCISIGEGKPWLGFNCTQGKVLYVNLELDRASCLHRFKDVYQALGYEPNNISNIDIWNLRGKSLPMDQLAPKLIRRANKKNYIAIVIDPIYKIITGDENSADQMAKFCNQFDKVCTELNCAIIYCHHHSKGNQSSKRSMDRASGSGVFARDPDALLDLIELELTERTLEKANKDDSKVTAWRIEGTLREYPRFKPVNVWFEHPVHKVDDKGWLRFVDAEGEKPWKKGGDTMRKRAEQRQADLEMAFANTQENGTAYLKNMAEYLGVSDKTVKNHIAKSEIYGIKNGVVFEKNSGNN